ACCSANTDNAPYEIPQTNADKAQEPTSHTEPSSRRIAIITDSVAQVPPDIAQRLGIRIIPFIVSLDGNEYLDGVDLPPLEFYKRMRLEKATPTTSAPSIGSYVEIFRDCLESGVQDIVYVALCGRLSMAYSAAQKAADLLRADFPDSAIVIADSKLATIAQGFLAIEAAQLVAEGGSVPEIVARIEEGRQRVGFVAALDTLEYLARGGRIGKAAALLGSTIKIKPIISIDKDGLVTPVTSVRGGNRRALKELVKRTAKRVGGKRLLHLAVMQADAQDRVAQLQAMAIEELHPDEIFVTDFTPVMGAHTGPGLIGLAYHLA
ncbi:MAG: DegV family protein, partial [Anaerolineae bacterium]